MKTISAFFYRISKGWVVLTALTIFVLFSIVFLPGENARVADYSHGLGNPDTHLVYNGTTLLQMAEEYGDSGRTAYIESRRSLDLVFPFIYTIFFIIAISFLFKGTAGQKNFPSLNLIPLLGLIFDLFENLAVSSVLAIFPLQDKMAITLAPVFSLLKWVFFFASLLLLVAGIILQLEKHRLNKAHG